MELFIEFLKEYGQYIIGGIVLLLSVISMCIKQRPKTIDDFSSIVGSIVEKVAHWCASVEVPGQGVEKHNQVIDMALKEARSLLGRKLTNTEIAYIYKKVDSQIEEVLSAPSKKGE